jgi:predicted DNA-binding transcriptional regulator AlpA
LAEVQADPTLLSRVPLDVLVDLRRQVRHLDADVDAAIARQMLRGHRQPDVAEVLDVETAAKRLGTSRDSLYRKRKRLRLGYIDPLDGKLKFTDQEITEYIRRQRRS